MDWLAYKATAQEYIKKYKYIIIAILAGILMMTYPGPKSSTVVVHQEEEKIDNLEESLAQILSKVYGAGKVEVLLSEASGEQTIYQANENRSKTSENTDIRTDTVLVTDSNRNEAGLIRQINPPVYQGAIVLCQGADSASVQLAIVQAVGDVTGLTSDRITILKMK